MNRLLWGLLPDEAFPLLVLGIGLAVMLGLLTRRIWAVLVGLVIAPILLAPFVSSVIDGLPAWLLLVGLLVVAWLLLRGLLELVLGREAAGHVLGELVIRTVSGIFSVILLPFRLLLRLRHDRGGDSRIQPRRR